MKIQLDLNDPLKWFRLILFYRGDDFILPRIRLVRHLKTVVDPTVRLFSSLKISPCALEKLTQLGFYQLRSYDFFPTRIEKVKFTKKSFKINMLDLSLDFFVPFATKDVDQAIYMIKSSPVLSFLNDFKSLSRKTASSVTKFDTFSKREVNRINKLALA